MSTIALALNPTHFKTHVTTASSMFTESSHMPRIAMMAEVDCSRHELSLEDHQPLPRTRKASSTDTSSSYLSRSTIELVE